MGPISSLMKSPAARLFTCILLGAGFLLLYGCSNNKAGAETQLFEETSFFLLVNF